MQAIAGELQIVIAATLFLLLVTSFVIAFIFIHQIQHHKYVREREEIKNNYKQEILKAQLEVKEHTMNSLSQEIHDNIGQILSLAKLNLSTLKQHEINEVQFEDKLKTTKELISKSIQDLRELSKRLNSEFIIKQSLPQAIERELEYINKTGLYETDITTEGQAQALDDQKKLILFRISQEILNNIIKHAFAKKILVRFHYMVNNISLFFQDDGIGFNFDIARENVGTGLGNIIHRARLIGADIKFTAPPSQQGTLIIITLPYESSE
ncbi:two-component system NarL family sensor kinase [Catalinimonas alkaloidigena]|uniref:sensor histidine kinase n=1 Tax=Catalinimonas alkaloidigena TaxID=1075417 RepID=UPI002405888E|nr:histidine kinase [Catalinimonas alkaloidigena]MDF9797131.1 two-component system NarL family sensor kinase [Catalinimonas alkaloidigena]